MPVGTDVGEPEPLGQLVVHQVDECFQLIADLLIGAEEVGVVLGEALYSEEACDNSTQLFPEQEVEVRNPQREVPVTPLPGHVVEYGGGAVHRLEAECLFVFSPQLRREHVVYVVLEVTTHLPEVDVREQGGTYLDVTPLLNLPPDRLNQQVLQSQSLVVPVRHARGRLVEAEEVQFLPYRAMVILRQTCVLYFLHSREQFLRASLPPPAFGVWRSRDLLLV